MGLSTRTLALLAILAVSIPIVYASSGDRNPTFQHCLRGCSLTYCDPSQPPIPYYLRLFGWTCAENCAYECTHSFTDNIRPGSRFHQFYGKWAFYRLGPFQEPLSILMSIGNLYVNLQGVAEVRRRIRPENKLRPWLLAAGYVQVNTWVWSAVFHGRDTPTTERLDYFSATLTISFTLLYALIRIFHFQTPLSTTRFLLPTSAAIAFLVLGHFTYLLSFPLGSFPYGYHTLFNLVLGMVHNTIWVLWSFSFKFPYPSYSFAGYTLSWPRSYPPHDALSNPSPSQAGTPALLVALTTLAMSLELWDFSPVLRIIDAHSLWHAATIPLAMGWWSFLVLDAIELEGALMGQRGMGIGEKEGEKGLKEGEVPRTPTFRELASGSARLASPSPSPGARVRVSPKAERNE
ncbi:hypothetical protein IAR50_000871 [Cryptococcus sp. DSM 104548]